MTPSKEHVNPDGERLIRNLRGHRIAAPIPAPQPEVLSIRVVEVTPALLRQLKKYGLRHHLWHGYPIIDYASDLRDVDHRARASSGTDYEPLRYLLSWDYEDAIRELQIAENNRRWDISHRENDNDFD